MKKMTIIDFVEKYTHEYSELTFLREKVDGVWTETTFRETREFHNAPLSCVPKRPRPSA